MYPPQFLLLPVRLCQRLPPSLQSVDLEVILVVHTVSTAIRSQFNLVSSLILESQGVIAGCLAVDKSHLICITFGTIWTCCHLLTFNLNIIAALSFLLDLVNTNGRSLATLSS